MNALQNVVSSAWAGIAASAIRASASDAHVKALFNLYLAFPGLAAFDDPTAPCLPCCRVDMGSLHHFVVRLSGTPRRSSHDIRHPPPWRAPHHFRMRDLKREK